MRHDLSFLYGYVPRLSLRQKLVLYLSGKVFVHNTRLKGHCTVAVYAVRCKQHGVYVDTPHGLNDYFQCPECLAEVHPSADQEVTQMEISQTDFSTRAKKLYGNDPKAWKFRCSGCKKAQDFSGSNGGSK